MDQDAAREPTMPVLKHVRNFQRFASGPRFPWLPYENAEKGVVREDAAEDLGKAVASAEHDLSWKPW